jgi:hypothetical protein
LKKDDLEGCWKAREGMSGARSEAAMQIKLFLCLTLTAIFR